MSEATKTVDVYHHPDALMPDVPVKVKIDTGAYRPLAGPLTVIGRHPGGILLGGAGGGCLSLTACSAGMVRIRALPSGNDIPPSVTEGLRLVQVPADPVAVEVVEGGGGITLRLPGLSVFVDLKTADIRVADASGTTLLATKEGGLRFSSETPEYGGHRFFARFDLDPDEGLFGGGGRIMRPNRTGHGADMFAVKAGLYSGDYGGFPVPFFLSTKGYGIFLNNPWPHVCFDFGRTTPGEWFLHAPGGDCDLFVFAGPEFPSLMGHFTRLVGRLPAPRRWWTGFWCGTLSIARAPEALDACRRFREAGLPVDAIQIDGNWRGGLEFLQRYMQDGAYTSRDFNWHPDFGDGSGMVKQLREMGIRTVLHVNSRPFSEATTAKGVAEGWLRQQGFETVVRVGDPTAEAKYREMIAGRNAEGIGCWLQDHGDRVSGEVLPGIPSRNLFGALWARATTVTGTDDGDPSRVVFTRGAGIGGQRHCIVWSGDTRVGIDFFEQDLWFMMNAGLAGYPLNSCDLGGFMFADKFSAPHNVAFDRDNLARRLCQSLLFMPTPRTQDDARDPAKFPWNCPPDIARLYGEMLRLRYRMIPYLYSYLVQGAKTGEPIIRPLVYHHRTDRVAWETHDELYFGEWLLIAPVVKKGALHRTVYLPEGRWINYWTGRETVGPTVVLETCPFDRPEGLPIYVKAGAILPSQADVDRLGDEPPGELRLDVYPAGRSEFVLRDSMTLETVITCEGRVGRVDVTIRSPLRRVFHVKVHGAGKDTELRVNGVVAAGVDQRIEV